MDFTDRKSPGEVSGRSESANRGRFSDVCMVIGVVLMMGSLVAQLVQNEEAKEDIERGTSPWYIILYPIAVLFKLNGEYRLIHEACKSHKDITIVLSQGLGVFVLLFGHAVWIGQYAMYTTTSSLRVLYMTISALTAVVAVVSIYYIVREYTKFKRQKTEDSKSVSLTTFFPHPNSFADSEDEESDDENYDRPPEQETLLKGHFLPEGFL